MKIKIVVSKVQTSSRRIIKEKIHLKAYIDNQSFRRKCIKMNNLKLSVNHIVLNIK